MKKIFIISCLFLLIFSLQGCKIRELFDQNNHNNKNNNTKDNQIQNLEKIDEELDDRLLIDKEGKTLMDRILTPKGYIRVISDESSLSRFIRHFEMTKDGSNVKLFNGKDKEKQDSHVAIFNLPLENYDYQQSAESVIRMYAEYYMSIKQYDKISVKIQNDFDANYGIWRKGNRFKSLVREFIWIMDDRANDSDESYKEYLKTVFSYVGPDTIYKDSVEVTSDKIEVGDILIKAGNDGHVIMVVDVCTNVKGEKAFLLAQGGVPAQEFYVLKNPAHLDDPWYYVNEINYPLKTPEFTFEKGSLKRPNF